MRPVVTSLALSILVAVDVVCVVTSFGALSFHEYRFIPPAGIGHAPPPSTHFLAEPPASRRPAQCDGVRLVEHHVHSLSTLLPLCAAGAVAAWAVVSAAALSARVRTSRVAALAAPLLQPLLVGFPRAFSSCGEWCGHTELHPDLPLAYAGSVVFLLGGLFFVVLSMVLCEPPPPPAKGSVSFVGRGTPTAVGGDVASLPTALRNALFVAFWLSMYGVCLAGYLAGSPCRLSAVAYVFAPLYAALFAMGAWRFARGLRSGAAGVDPFFYHKAVAHQFRPCGGGGDDEEPSEVEEYDPRAEAYLELADPRLPVAPLRPSDM